ncbi:eggshell protein 2A-like [Penaeus indicus]|uniref:eggshell protein 2A-like n=1 Tax=Penaeus indicus TaxID=29960 RepID=UPI00300C5F79
MKYIRQLRSLKKVTYSPGELELHGKRKEDFGVSQDVDSDKAIRNIKRKKVGNSSIEQDCLYVLAAVDREDKYSGYLVQTSQLSVHLPFICTKCFYVQCILASRGCRGFNAGFRIKGLEALDQRPLSLLVLVHPTILSTLTTSGKRRGGDEGGGDEGGGDEGGGDEGGGDEGGGDEGGVDEGGGDEGGEDEGGGDEGGGDEGGGDEGGGDEGGGDEGGGDEGGGDEGGGDEGGGDEGGGDGGGEDEGGGYEGGGDEGGGDEGGGDEGGGDEGGGDEGGGDEGGGDEGGGGGLTRPPASLLPRSPLSPIYLP